MKYAPKLINPAIFILSITLIILISSCTDTGNKQNASLQDTTNKTIVGPVLTEPGNIFINMATSVQDFKRISGPGQNFKKIICQFKNEEYNIHQNGFIYSSISYALRNNDYFDSGFLKKSKGNILLTPPYRFGNLEMKTHDIDKYIMELSRHGTPIDDFDSVSFKPFIDNSYGSRIVNLKVIPFRTVQLLDSTAVTVTSTKLNPCPPARQ